LQDPRYLPNQSIPVAEFIETKPPKPGTMPMGERVALYISEHQREFPGVTVEPVSVRAYPFQRLAAHVLGFVGLITAEDLDALDGKGDYGQNDIIGRAGLEQVYERYLRGEQGVQRFVVNADGEILRSLASVEPRAGADLHLTLEIDDQQAAERALAAGLQRARTMEDSEGRSIRANAGVVIVMDADTGGIRAITSLPTFNPAWYVKGLTPMQEAYLSNGDLAPTLDRAIQPYVPGSAFKPITALAAIKEQIASTTGAYLCSTDYTHPGDTSGAVFTNWTTSNRYMSLAEALRVSCDTVFYRFGSAFYDRYVANQLAPDAQVLQGDLREWGFDEPTGIDVPGEAGGLVPDAAWAESAKTADGKRLFPYGWVPGGDILTMIGATYPTATPLQMAQAYASIANGGRICRPHLLDQVVAPDGTVVKDISPRCERQLPYTAAQLQYIRNALYQVVDSGTANCAFSGFPLWQLPVMGKTGTAERGSPDFQDTSWFAAMVGPIEAPEYVVVTMVEQGGFGGQVAAPITRDVIERIEGLEDSPSPGCGVEDG
jgi:penicillin-binding protein 2